MRGTCKRKVERAERLLRIADKGRLSDDELDAMSGRVLHDLATLPVEQLREAASQLDTGDYADRAFASFVRSQLELREGRLADATA